MKLTRRAAMITGMTGLAMLGTRISPGFAQEEGGDTVSLGEGELTVHPVSHASVVLEAGDTVIYVDPVGGAGPYEGFPEPDLILITHEHSDHYEPETLQALIADDTQMITNPAVFDMLPDSLRDSASQLANDESTEVAGIGIEAIPAYNTTEDRLQYHPEGRDNGYVLSLMGGRVYIAGDTEDIPEMRALEDIDLAFVPMNLPYTMTVEQAASAVAEFAPMVVYPYHYRGSDVERFKSLVEEESNDIEVRLAGWYDG
ncbi:MBL fold metallo-hydrolase [Nitratireductor sp. GCM10026969]|uniref:MBL fold metallo-hydrolase n=1 Tax=Nitratireductor sp. GCM10026969 TaxID=3252645 RepID=UPI0036099125